MLKVNVVNGVRLSDCVMVVIVGYVPGLVMLYLHLLKQRRKVLGKVGEKKKGTRLETKGNHLGCFFR